MEKLNSYIDYLDRTSKTLNKRVARDNNKIASLTASLAEDLQGKSEVVIDGDLEEMLQLIQQMKDNHDKSAQLKSIAADLKSL